jgi:hypothetical protein
MKLVNVACEIRGNEINFCFDCTERFLLEQMGKGNIWVPKKVWNKWIGNVDCGAVAEAAE